MKFFVKHVNCHGSFWILHTRNRHSIERFIEIIRPYVVSSMRYKIKTSYVKPIKEFLTQEKILKIMRQRVLKRHMDFLRYKNGRRLYDAVRWHFGSLKKCLKAVS